MVLDSDQEQDQGFGEGSPYAAHLDRGWSLLEQGDAKGAARSGEKARESLPEDPDACMLLAAAAQYQGDFESALAHYEEAIELDPDYPEPYLSAAQMLSCDQEQHGAALRMLEEVRGIDDLLPSEEAEITLLAADCALAEGQDAMAEQELSRCAGVGFLRDLFPSSREDESRALPQLVERLCQFHGQEPSEAAQLDQEELEALLMRMAMLCFRIARIDCELEQEARASKLLGAVLHYLPTHAECWHLLSECEYRQGNMRAAMDAAFKVHALDAEQPSAPCPWDDKEMLEKVSELYRDLFADSQRATIEATLELELTLLERPGVELLYEGLDPRAVFLILRPHLEEAPEPHPATLVVYRQNLARLIEPSARPELGQEVAEQLKEVFDAQLADQGPGRTRSSIGVGSGRAEPGSGSGRSGGTIIGTPVRPEATVSHKGVGSKARGPKS